MTVRLRYYLCLGIVLAAVFFFTPGVEAQNFGDFEVLQSLLGDDNQGAGIDSFVDQDRPFTDLFNRAVQIVIALTVLLGVGGVVVGGYFYMTAQGNATQVQKGKDFIKTSLLAIVLAVAAVMLLNTISPQFGEDIEEPNIACASIEALEGRDQELANRFSNVVNQKNEEEAFIGSLPDEPAFAEFKDQLNAEVERLERQIQAIREQRASIIRQIQNLRPDCPQ